MSGEQNITINEKKRVLSVREILWGLNVTLIPDPYPVMSTPLSTEHHAVIFGCVARGERDLTRQTLLETFYPT